MAKGKPSLQAPKKTNWKAASRMFLTIGLFFLVWSSAISWIYRDGFEPNRVRSEGSEALSRFASKVWTGVAISAVCFIASRRLANRSKEAGQP